MSDKDIVLDLNRRIFTEYNKLIASNSNIDYFYEKLNKGKAESSDVSVYGGDLGECASQALIKYINPSNLPNGKLYWNIAERIINQLLFDIYERVNSVAEIIQKQEDAKQNINVRAQKPEFPKERVHDLIEKTIEIFESENSVDEKQ